MDRTKEKAGDGRKVEGMFAAALTSLGEAWGVHLKLLGMM